MTVPLAGVVDWFGAGSNASTVAPRDIGLADVLRIAGTRRFIAASRRRLRTAARQGMVIVVLTAAIDCLWIVPLDNAAAWVVVVANLVVATSAVIGWSLLVASRRWPSEATLLCVLALVDAATIVVALGDRQMLLLSAAYALLGPVAVALVIPWSTRLHALWLAGHAVLVMVGLAAAGADRPGLLLGLLIVASALSLFGHVTNLRARVMSHVQIQRITALNRRARRDELGLRGLNARLEAMVRADALTGLGNRVALGTDLAIARDRIIRYGERYGLLILDLDHFKAINDQRGHFAGDQVLRAVATAIARGSRLSDVTYRFGGEEFVILAPLGPGADVRRLAERVRSCVAQLAIAHPANPPWDHVTISCGAIRVDRSRIGESIDDWLRSADAALYEAKRRGRNACVVVADPATADDRPGDRSVPARGPAAALGPAPA